MSKYSTDDSPIVSGPPLPPSRWKWAEDIRQAEQAKANRQAGIRLAPKELVKLLELPAWKGAKIDGSPTIEDKAQIKKDIERARRALADANYGQYASRELALLKEQWRLKRAEDPRALRIMHPSGTVLIWLPKEDA